MQLRRQRGLGYLLKEPRYTARWYFAMFAPSWLSTAGIKTVVAEKDYQVIKEK